MSPDPQWMPKTSDHTKSYIDYVFSNTYIPVHLKEALLAFVWQIQIASMLVLCSGAIISRRRVTCA